MNAAARMIFAARKFEHITPLLRELHWLRVPQRIDFKLGVLAFRCLHGMAPPYLANQLHRVADIDSRQTAALGVDHGPHRSADTSLDDRRPGVMGRCTPRLERPAASHHLIAQLRHLSTSAEDTSVSQELP